LFRFFTFVSFFYICFVFYTPFLLHFTLGTPAPAANLRPGIEEERAAVGAVVLDLVGDAVAAERADEVLDVVVSVADGSGRVDVLDVVAAVVAACLAGVRARFTEHAVGQVAIVADVDHLVALAAASLVRFRHSLAVDAAHQVLDAAIPLVAACRDCLEVHAVDDCVAEVAAVVAVVVGNGHEVHAANVFLDLGNALLDLVACHV
jgi:hypothetical protein